MIRLGSILFILGIVLFIVFPSTFIFTDDLPMDAMMKWATGITVLGGIILLVGVLLDRYNEHKEDLENDDYRKY